MKQFSKLLEKTLWNSFQSYFQHAMHHRLAHKKTYVDCAQTTLNVQMSIELLAKHFSLKKQGWKSIIEKKHHSQSEDVLIKCLKNGTLKTIYYEKAKKILQANFDWDESDKELIRNFQSHRNALVHLGLPKPPEQIAFQSTFFLLRVINRIIWHDNASPNHYGKNRLREFLGEKTYQLLFHDGSYVAEAIDLALDNEIVYFCLECKNETWVENEREDLLCLACGYKMPIDSVGFLECKRCEQKRGIAYDALQGSGIKLQGKCIPCDRMVHVIECKDCGLPSEYFKGWECDACR